jgi:cation transport protein ChaC
LRSRITKAETSFFRSFSVERELEQNPEMEAFRDWVHTDEQREAIRTEALKDHEGDLWVFAYGSLMWDPALHFAEVRRAYVEGYERRFILKDDKGGRGSPDAPGLFAALDRGAGCEGLAFRIAAEAVDTETEILFRREVIGPGYLPGFVPIHFGGTSVSALSFLADHNCPDICGEISREDQIFFIATGYGTLGSSREYLANIVEHFTHLGIEDAGCTGLLRDVDAFIAGLPAKGPDQ